MQLAEFFSSQPNRLWHLAKQMNVNYAVGGLPWEEKSEKPWDLMPLIRMKQRYADFGLTLSVIESMPPSNNIKLGTPGRDEEIEIFQQFIVNMGAAGIPVLCYNFTSWRSLTGSAPRRQPARAAGRSYQATTTA